MKKTLIIILTLMIAFSFAACGGSGGKDPSNEAAEQTDVVIDLIKLGNQLAESGEDEAAKTVFERAAAVLKQRMENPEYIMPDYQGLVSEKSAELATCLAVSEALDNSKESVGIPKSDFDWGN